MAVTWGAGRPELRPGATQSVGTCIRQVKIVPADNVWPVPETLAASDWSVVII